MSARRSTNREAGFTLVEALVGLLLVSALVAGVGDLLVMSLAATRDARDETSASLLAVQRLEALVAAVAAGAAMASSPDNALEADTPGFTETVDTNGRPILSLAGPPSSAVFLRRWRVRPLPSDPSRAWVVQVRVLTARRALVSPPAPGAARVPGDVLLTTVRRAE